MRTLIYIASSLFLITVLNACGGSSSSSEQTDAEILEDRPFQLTVPTSYDVNIATPLVVLLHGFGGTGDGILSYFRMAAAAERHGFLVAYPDGILNSVGQNFWRATNASGGSSPGGGGDVRYLSIVMDDVQARYNVDPKQIFFVGYSNGGFMSHRMACDRSSRIAAVVSLAGMPWSDPHLCQTQEPVSVLQVHGDLDSVVLYSGGFIGTNSYPSAVDTVSDWATRNGCAGTLVDTAMNLNLDVSLAGDETRVQSFSNCPAAGETELWTVLGGSHGPDFDDTWPDFIWGFLSSHPKP